MSNQNGFVAGTLVHTDKGLVPIQDVYVGDLVLSRPELGGKDAQTEYKKVVRSFCSGEAEQIRLNCQCDSEYDDIDAPIYIEFMSSNNKVWVEGLKKWVSVSELGIGASLSDIDNKDNLRILSLENVYKAYVNEKIIIGCCHKPSFGSGEEQELDMFIQFDKDKLLIDADYMADYKISEANFIKYELDISEKIYDNYQNNKIWNRELRVSVYNLEVEDFHTYFVGELGVWVHQ